MCPAVSNDVEVSLCVPAQIPYPAWGAVAHADIQVETQQVHKAAMIWSGPVALQ